MQVVFSNKFAYLCRRHIESASAFLLGIETGTFDLKEGIKLMLVSFLGTGDLQSSLRAVPGLDFRLGDLPAFFMPSYERPERFPPSEARRPPVARNGAETL